MTQPAPTPEQKKLQRVIRVSALDGWSVIVVAALGFLLTLVLGDWSGAGVGLLVAGCGAMEVHGHRRLKRRDPSGMRWLVQSQLFLLSVILVYCASRLGSFDEQTVMGNLTPDMAAVLNEAGVSTADLLPLVRLVFYTTYSVVAGVALFYQGGMALYYRRRIPAVESALAAPPLL